MSARVNHLAARVAPAALSLLVVVVPPAARAQAPADSAALAAADSLRSLASASAIRRTDWLSDRTPLRVGDLLTVVVDEQASANERVTHVATGNRGMRADLSTSLAGDAQAYNIHSGLQNDTRDVGEAGRSGGLTAVITVRVVGFGPNGLARVEGTRKVNVDGREQQVTLTGLVRPGDVRGSNLVESSRIADAVILYKGKKISPRSGFIGKLLGMVWP